MKTLQTTARSFLFFRIYSRVWYKVYNIYSAFCTISQGRKDFIKRLENTKPEENSAANKAATEEAIENIYETIDDAKEPETDLAEGQVKRPRRKKLSVSQNKKRLFS